MALTVNSTYNGVAIPLFLQKLFYKLDVFEKRVVGLHTGVNKKLTIPTIDISGDTLQKYALNPTPAGTITLGERAIEPEALIKVISNIAPLELEQFWAGLGMANTNDLLATLSLEANATFRDAFAAILLESTSQTMAADIWTGLTASTFDGFITVLEADGAGLYEDVSPGAPAVITAANVFGYLEDVRQGALQNRKALFQKMNKIIMCSYSTAGFIQNAEANISGKGGTPLAITPFDQLTYYGIPVVPFAGFPDDYLIMTYVGDNIRDTNLHVGFRNTSDMEYVEFYKQAQPSFGYGMKCAFDFGVNWGRFEDVVYLKAV
jgi:hypothetical protein